MPTPPATSANPLPTTFPIHLPLAFLLCLPDLPAAPLKVYLALAVGAARHPDRLASTTGEELARLTRLAPRSVWYALSTLQRLGLLRRHPSHDMLQPSIFQLLTPPLPQVVQPAAQHKHSASATPCTTPAHAPTNPYTRPPAPATSPPLPHIIPSP